MKKENKKEKVKKMVNRTIDELSNKLKENQMMISKLLSEKEKDRQQIDYLLFVLHRE